MGETPRWPPPLGGKRGKACLGWLQDEQFSAPACQNLKSLYRSLNWGQSCTLEAPTGSVTYPVQVVSSAHFQLEAVSLGSFELRKASGAHIPSTGEGLGSLQLPRSISGVRLVDDLPQQAIYILFSVTWYTFPVSFINRFYWSFSH